MESLPAPFGKYLLTKHIASGGMADVFKAKAFGIAGFEKVVAIKRIHPHLSIDQDFINMFIDEARIASNLSHPNIVQIFDLGSIDNMYFIAMEYIEGITAENYIRSAPLDRERIVLSCFIAREVANALQYAHSRTIEGKPMNLVHRDISPQNILLSEDGTIKLTDFGVAKARFRLSKTESGMTKGKYPYMAPEQVTGNPVDHRSDIFSLSVVLYELLTGQMAFQGETEFEIMESIKKCEYKPIKKLNNAIPDEVEWIVVKGMQKNPAHRFASAGELAMRLSEIIKAHNQVELHEKLSETVKSIKGNRVEKEKKDSTKTIVVPALKIRRKKTRMWLGGMGTFLLALLAINIMINDKNHHEEIKNKVNNENLSIKKENIPPQELVQNTEEQQAVLNINSSPWSYVFIDGKKVGDTPVSSLTLTPGVHNIIFQSPAGKKKILTVHLAPGEKRTIFENLE